MGTEKIGRTVGSTLGNVKFIFIHFSYFDFIHSFLLPRLFTSSFSSPPSFLDPSDEQSDLFGKFLNKTFVTMKAVVLINFTSFLNCNRVNKAVTARRYRYIHLSAVCW